MSSFSLDSMFNGWSISLASFDFKSWLIGECDEASVASVRVPVIRSLNLQYCNQGSNSICCVVAAAVCATLLVLFAIETEDVDVKLEVLCDDDLELICKR